MAAAEEAKSGGAAALHGEEGGEVAAAAAAAAAARGQGADAAGGGTLEVVHEVVDLLAGGGHDCVCGDGHGKGGIYIGSEEWLLNGRAFLSSVGVRL